MAGGCSSIGEAMARWRPRQYVLLGMFLVLAVSAVTIVASVVLRPVPIRFSVTNFSFTNNQTDAEQGRKSFTFNLTSHNPSRRAGVAYRYVLVSMQLQSAGVRKTSVPAHVREPEDGSKVRQGTSSNRTMAVDAQIDNEFYGFYSNASATVQVFARVRFRVGIASSRAYNVRATCDRVYLLHVIDGTWSKAVNCKAVL